MSLRINHNTTAINSHRQLLLNDKSLSKSLERLSSGMKINRAADATALYRHEHRHTSLVETRESVLQFLQFVAEALLLHGLSAPVGFRIWIGGKYRQVHTCTEMFAGG